MEETSVSDSSEFVSYEEFKRMDIRIGTIRFVEPVAGSDKLLRCLVEIGDEIATDTFVGESGVVYKCRQIVSGIREYVTDLNDLIGKQVLYIVNLEPRTIRGVVSSGMLLAVGEGAPVFLVPEVVVASGSKVR